MTDREMLELAAKAAGMTVEYDPYASPSGEDDWFITDEGYGWNPRDDDGDALRLAVQLGLYFGEHKNGMGCHAGISSVPGFFVNQIEHYSDHPDKCAASRRAITRAAAEIGRRMQHE